MLLLYVNIYLATSVKQWQPRATARVCIGGDSDWTVRLTPASGDGGKGYRPNATGV